MKTALKTAPRLLSLAVLASSASYAQQEGYGYGGMSQGGSDPIAAPSTIPGQRSTGPRVPQVQPAQPAQRPPARPAPGAIPWGSAPGGNVHTGPNGSRGGMSGGMTGGSPSAGGGMGGTGSSSGMGAGTGAGMGTGMGGTVRTAPPAAPAGGMTGTAAPATPADQSTRQTPTTPSTPPVEAAAPARPAAPVMRQRDSAPTAPPAAAPELGSANVRLSERFRSLPSEAAAESQSIQINSAVRGTAAVRRVGDGNPAATETQSVAAPALVCARNGNLPSINRLRPAQEQGLMPGAALVVQGNCFGSSAGAVRLMLPTPRGRIRAVDAQVLNWEPGKLFVQLPADVQNVIPGEATVEVWAADGRRSAAQTIAFEPRWALVPLPVLPARVQACQGEFALSRCKVNDDSEASPRFAMPKDCRYSGLGTCFGGNAQDPEAPAGESFIFGQHYTQDVIRFRKDHPSPRGQDVYALNLPPYLKPSHCAARVTAFETEPGQQDSSASARFVNDAVVVDWAFTRYGEPGWLHYQVRCQVWAPVGVVLP